jgi:hypothetical protein
MAEAVGKAGLHAVQGRCDLCSELCDPETQELNALDCTYAPQCPPECAVYHQDCLARYLKTIRLEKCALTPYRPRILHRLVWACCARCCAFICISRKVHNADVRAPPCRNRKTGFKCPRGCGKLSAYSEPCPGKVHCRRAPSPPPLRAARRCIGPDDRLTWTADRQVASDTRPQRQRQEAPQGRGVLQHQTLGARSSAWLCCFCCNPVTPRQGVLGQIKSWDLSYRSMAPVRG